MMLFDDLAGRGGYLLLLVLTFAMHALLVGFVLGAAAWATLRALRGGDDPIAGVARDWLPFGLGAAITAGVAPLLLVQVLYQHRMYTATLLLSHRFMAIVPVLIAGFYLLYLGKSARVQAWSRTGRVIVHGASLAAFVFVAWTWAEEHTLAAATPAVWVEHYRDGRMFHRDPVIVERLAIWFGMAATAFAVGAAWLGGSATTETPRRLGRVGLGGVIVAIAAAAVFGARHGGDVPAVAGLWLVTAALSAAASGVGFVLLVLGSPRPARMIATAGVVGLYVSASAVRESMRVARVQWRGTLDGTQGLWLFLAFVVLAIAAIAWCARLVRRHLDSPDAYKAAARVSDSSR